MRVCVKISHVFFTHSPTDGRSGGLHASAAAYKAAVNGGQSSFRASLGFLAALFQKRGCWVARPFRLTG